MEPACLIDDAEFWLPPEFLTNDDFLVEKENKKESLFSYEPSHGFGFDSGEEERFLARLSRKMAQSTLQDDFSGAKAWSTARSPQAVAAAAAWDMYCDATEELSMMNLNGYNNHNSGRGLLDLPRNGSGFYSRQSLQYQKLQAIQFQQLKRQQLMKHHRQLAQQRVNNHSKSTGHVDLSPSAWPQRRAIFLGDRTGKRGSTGTGVFLPRSVNQTSPVTPETRQKPTLGTVLVPARVAQVLNLHESMGHQPAVRSSASLNDVSWRQRSNNGGYSSQMKIEHAVNEPQLPSEWAY